MTFREKLLAFSTLAGVIAAVAPGAQASGIKLNYVEKSLSDPIVREIWADKIGEAEKLGSYAPWAMVAEVTRPDGSKVYVSQLWAGNACSMKECPVRIFQNGELAASFMACDATDSHVLSSTATSLLACDSAFPTGIR
jgi:hypothetical protein